MTELIIEELRRLAGTLAVLNGRVKEAVAGEVGRAVADAVAEVLTIALGGRLPRATTYAKWGHGHARSEWDDPDASGWHGGYSPFQQSEANGSGEPAAETHAPAALAVAVAAGKWWLSRNGSQWQAAGLTLAAGVALLGGGPMTRAAVAVIWAAQKLRTATAALGDGAQALDRV
jgi:hypothetical protein